ncbi:hypothetical protein D3C75_952240 [compost metagenome]
MEIPGRQLRHPGADLGDTQKLRFSGRISFGVGKLRRQGRMPSGPQHNGIGHIDDSLQERAFFHGIHRTVGVQLLQLL